MVESHGVAHTHELRKAAEKSCLILCDAVINIMGKSYQKPTV